MSERQFAIPIKSSMPARLKKPDQKKQPSVSHLLLRWYDAHKRDLPWRNQGDQPPDPYAVWLSEIMLQQTTVAAVKPYYEKFLTRFPTIHALASAEQQDVLRAWAGLGYYSRARNLHLCAQQIVKTYQGQFPDTYDLLKALPGIGDYTASAIMAIAFSKYAIVIDGNVERVVSRVARIETPLPAAKKEIRACLETITPHKRCGDFAQAMMDLGATVCTPRSPDCGQCPLQPLCRSAHAQDVERFPYKMAKTARPRRFGHAFVVLREDESLLLRNRAETGLLGGMSEVPNSDWMPAPQTVSPQDILPLKLKWQEAPERVKHVFTHFELDLTVFVATAPIRQGPPATMRFVPLDQVMQEALPSVMKKVITTGLRALGLKHAIRGTTRVAPRKS
jgi:A/G-specific adenine glycosylase